MSKVRICEWPTCRTQLSSYNLGAYCWAHTEDFRASPVLRRVPDHMSDDFVDNLPGAYDIDEDDLEGSA